MSPKGGAYGSRKQRNEFRPHKHRANSKSARRLDEDPNSFNWTPKM